METNEVPGDHQSLFLDRTERCNERARQSQKQQRQRAQKKKVFLAFRCYMRKAPFGGDDFRFGQYHHRFSLAPPGNVDQSEVSSAFFIRGGFPVVGLPRMDRRRVAYESVFFFSILGILASFGSAAWGMSFCPLPSSHGRSLGGRGVGGGWMIGSRVVHRFRERVNPRGDRRGRSSRGARGLCARK